ncbi:MAG: hypothetical protein WBJ10_06070 [Daejeonella sp.]
MKIKFIWEEMKEGIRSKEQGTRNKEQGAKNKDNARVDSTPKRTT